LRYNTTILYTGFLLFTIHHSLFSTAQETPATSNIEQQLENLTDIDQSETEDDSYLQQMQHFLKNPLNINTATADELRELKIISDLQIDNLISYRNLFGKLISVYELQAVPSWDLTTIKKILPLITVSNAVPLSEEFRKRFTAGEHSILLRIAQVLERSKGFNNSSTGTKYSGSPQRIFFRYRYTYKNLLQYGLAGDKDAGEQFLKGAQNRGFDFYSFHLFARNIGKFKSIALGDFTVNLGQGLIQWQSLAFRKSVDIINVKRQSTVLRPYNSAGEFNFHRGAGATMKIGKFETTVFASYRKLSANFVADTVSNEDFVSSFLTSGYNRTVNEIADRNKLNQFAVGGNILYKAGSWHIGLNGIHYNFSLPVQKRNEPYNLYAISGKSWSNFSVDYSFTYRNLHFFGEAAATKDFKTAFVNGLLLSVDSRVDISIVHRHISEQYQSINGNAFTENTFPTNEKGLFTGISIKPSPVWRFDAYMDIFSFPWLKYLVDAPSRGNDFFAQLTYSPNKQTEIYTRFRNETKEANQSENNTVTNYLVKIPRQNWRTQIRYKIDQSVTLRNRVEVLWYDKNGINSEKGFLTYFDILYKPLLKPFSANIRLQYFETDDYNSRIYAYENDLLYSYAIPAFYDKGWRYYLNLNYDVSKRISIWFKWGQTIYTEKNTVGSGLDEINNNQKSEIKFQVIMFL
jgi:hypothetical protein